MKQEPKQSIVIFTIDELVGRARDRALDKVREFQMEWGWWEDTLEYWADEKLAEYGIYNVVAKDIYFDLGRGCQRVALTDGWVNLKKILELKPEWFTNIALRVAAEGGMIGTPLITTSRDCGTTGVDDCYIQESDIDLRGTPFDGLNEDDFSVLVADAVEGLQREISNYVKDVAYELWKALYDELSSLQSEEYAVETAQANDWKFDEDGNFVI